jgi:abortive infection bacteriophage resistance protein
LNVIKPKLSLDGQIEHLKEKGVLFNIMDETVAKEYLAQNNNYFKLTAYRKIMISIRMERIKANI